MRKKCADCKTFKTLENFAKDKTQKLGIRSYCKSCARVRSLKWSQNSDNILKRKKYNYTTKKHISEYNKEYYKKNKKIIAQYKNKRYKINIQHRLALVLRSRIKSALKCIVKNGKSLELLGCSIEQYKKYLEKQFDKKMSWSNYGKYWEIDHIKPCNSFDLILAENQQKCFHYSNTRPLKIEENRSKSDKII